MNNIKEKLVDVFVSTFEVDASAIDDETSPDTMEQWDSLTHVQLILALEKAFELSISPNEGIELETFQDVREWVENKVNN